MQQRVEMHYGWTRRMQEVGAWWSSEAVCIRLSESAIQLEYEEQGGRSTGEKWSSVHQAVELHYGQARRV
jgi:hypothetical protein